MGGFWWGDRGRVVALGRVGTLAARLGQSEEALQIDRRLGTFDSSCPAGNRTYQRACIAAQFGDQDEAIRLADDRHDPRPFPHRRMECQRQQD